MKLFVVVLTTLFLISCSSTDQLTDITPPKLIEKTPFPTFPQRLASSNMQLDFEILVAKDGSVIEVKMVDKSGDDEWDAAAVEAVRKWKYTPAMYNDKPLKLWLRQTAILQFVDARCLCLGEVVCGTMTDADSAYSLLQNGSEFSDVVKVFSVSLSKENGGKVGDINIKQYPQAIQDVLNNLEPNQYSKPLKYKEQFVIFKRLKD